MTITFFDIPSSHSANAWSPNTFKTRMTLNYKGIPYKTEWLEYPYIEPTLKRLGIPPTGKKPHDGSDYYTLPAIYDDSTKTYVSDSIKIAEYLDATYLDTPALFPNGSRAAIALFQYHFNQTVVKHLVPLMMHPTCTILNPSSEAYFRRTRENWYKCKMEEIAPAGEKRDSGWKGVKEGFALLAEFYSKNGPNKNYLFGDTFSYADAIVVSLLLWIKTVLKENDEWQAVTTWDDGLWAKLVEVTKSYQAASN